jgi:hypothetical protein
MEKRRYGGAERGKEDMGMEGRMREGRRR